MRVTAVFDDLMPCDAVLSCDIDRLGRLVRLVDVGGARFVETDGRREPVPTLANGAYDLRCVGDSVLVWPTTEGSTLLRDGGVRRGPACEPREFFATPSFLFGAYGEQDILTGPDDSGAEDLITVFDQIGTRVLGAASLLRPQKQGSTFIELTRGASLGNELLFVADGSPHIWRFAPGERSLGTVLPARPVVVADHVSAVLLTLGQVGLVTSVPHGLRADWFNPMDGTMVGETLLSAEALRVQRHGALGWHLRAVADGAAITWDRQHVVRLSASAEGVRR